MARSPTRRARPAIPPATPPAIAAAFDFGAGVLLDVLIGGGDWLATVTADVAAAVVALRTTEDDVKRCCELLVEEETMLGFEVSEFDRNPVKMSHK